MNIQEFRQQHPEYNDMPDDVLSDRLYKKSYSDVPKDVFLKKFMGQVPSRPDEQKEPLTAGQVVGGFVKNLPSSTAKVIGTTVSAIAHPLRTTEAIGDIITGGIQKATGAESLGEGSQPEVQAFDAFTGMLKDRYGNTENIKRTIATDPAGFLMDLSTIMGGGGGVLKMAGLAKTGSGVSKAAVLIDPIQASLKAGGAVLKPTLGRLAVEALGTTTGTGRGSIEEALRGSKTLTATMRGETSGSEILGTAQSALQEIKNQRSLAYRPKLEAIGALKQSLDISPVKTRLEDMLKSFNVKNSPDGTLDFSRSVVNKNAQGEISELTEMVREWGSKSGDRTPVMVDVLKRRLDDFYSESKNSRAIVASVRNEASKLLKKEVPGYSEMTRSYAKTSQDIADIQKSLSLGTQYGADTALRKLTSVMRESFEFRKSFVDKLSAVSDVDLAAQIAGYNLRPIIPRGLIGKFALGTELTAAIMYAEPGIALALATASPKLVGEFMNLVGKSYRTAKQIPRSVPIAAFQAGRAEQETKAQVGNQ